jgi:hypothetical protein
MAQQSCMHLGTKLPDNQTCGGRCERFPACLPSPPSELPQQLAQLQADAKADRAAAQTTSRMLAAVRAAIARIECGFNKERDAN